jgi:hypothetical protein
MMLGRLQNTMIFACESLAELAGSDETGKLLLKLAKILERVGNDENDPVPRSLPGPNDRLAALPDP